jgi:DNA polymerase III subunit gamma/tau
MAGQYIVSALKYRPQTFDTVIGQSHITQTLKNALKSGQLAHSFLFCGPRGVGKTTCARILAKTINCLTPTTDNEACDTCENCVSFKNNTSFNIFELDAASNNSVDDIRELTEQVRFAPAGESKYKVYIIDEVHMLSTNAFNAFLKTLEEPPSYAIFILATTEKHKILPTILSRCQIFEFKRIVTKDTVEHLKAICAKENIPVEEDALHFIASKSEGCMRDALSIMDKITSFSGGSITYQSTIDNLNILDYDYFFKLTDAIATEDLSSALIMYDDILAKGFEGDMFLGGMAEHFRNLMMCKDAQIAKLMDVADGIKKKYFEQGVSISKNLILNAISIFNQAEVDYRMARNKRLHVEIALIKICNIAKAVKILNDGQGNIVQKRLSNNRIIAVTNNSPILAKPNEGEAITPSLLIEKSINKQSSLENVSKTETNIIVENNVSTSVINPTINPIVSQPTATSSVVLGENAEVNPYGLSLNPKDIMERARLMMAQKEELVKIPITEDNIIEHWNEFIHESVGGQDFFVASLQKCKIQFEDESISIEAMDVMSFDFLAPKKIDVAKWFKQIYKNKDLSLSIARSENVAPTEYIKSQRETFEAYIIDHPLLKEFKDRLGLDLESV